MNKLYNSDFYGWTKQQSLAKQLKVKYLKFWPWRKTPLTYCSLRINSTKCEFGSFLSTIEVEWLCQEIKTFLV